jgi:hypothetical protein
LKKLGFFALLLILNAPLHAQKAGDYYFQNYDVINLDFLRTRYYEIENGRPIQFEAKFKSIKWMDPYVYKERLRLIGFNSDKYNLLQFCLREMDDYHYTFPILMFHNETGELKELKQLAEGDEVIVYGHFYNLKKADFAIEVDVIETIKKGGHEQDVVIDGRVSPTPTPSATPTNTPGPSLWKRANDLINPPVTATPTGTITPEAAQ